MSRVIKAGMARLVPPLEVNKPEVLRDEEALAAEEEEAAPAADAEQDVRAAYDELIEAATNEVSYMLEDARREALSLRSEAITQAEQVLAEAKENGFAEGLREGHGAGMAEVREGFRELFDQGQQSIDALCNTLRADFHARVDAMREDVLRLSLRIAEKIIGSVLDDRDGAFLSLVQNALDSLKTDADVSVHLNPREFLTHFAAQDSITDPRRGLTIPVVSDPAVPPGGCWIDTETGVADASADAQLEQIAYSLGIRLS